MPDAQSTPPPDAKSAQTLGLFGAYVLIGVIMGLAALCSHYILVGLVKDQHVVVEVTKKGKILQELDCIYSGFILAGIFVFIAGIIVVHNYRTWMSAIIPLVAQAILVASAFYIDHRIIEVLRMA